MIIVHVTNYFHPKLGYQEVFLAREQAIMGHNVWFVTSDRYDSNLYSEGAVMGTLGERVKTPGFFEEEGIKVWRLKTLFEIPHGIWMLGLEKKIQELEPDIVIVHGIVSFNAIRIARLKKKSGKFKLIYDDHMIFYNSRSKLRMLYPLFKWTFSLPIQKAADALVGVGQPSKIFMNERYGIPLDRITVISMGADDTLFKFDAAARQEIRSNLSLSESDVVFIYTGKIIPKKRLSILIEAVKLLGDNDKLKVLFVGSGSKTYIEELKQDIKNKSLEDKFTWHDAVPNTELPKFYSSADVAVWPAGASISMLEALASSLPIIVSASPSINEMTYVSNQLTYQGFNPLNLAQQMEKLLDPILRKKIGASGRKLIEEKLNWKIIARQFIELVKEE